MMISVILLFQSHRCVVPSLHQERNQTPARSIRCFSRTAALFLPYTPNRGTLSISCPAGG